MIGPMKSNWISPFRDFIGGRQFCSVLGIFGLGFLPERLHGMLLSHFLWIASVSFGLQKCFAAIVILFMARCLLCKSVITVVRRLAETIIFSSKKASPYLVDSFRLYWLFSSGCCRFVFFPCIRDRQ